LPMLLSSCLLLLCLPHPAAPNAFYAGNPSL
jgi:hypothetical protein